MATQRNVRVAAYAGGLQAVPMGDPGSVHVVLFQQISAVGTSVAVPVPGGASSASLLSTVSGAPTAATVVVQGSVDGSTWVNLPSPGYLTSSPTPYQWVRLNCTALAGGTSPTITACAIVNP